MAKAKKLPSGNWRVLLYIGNDENGKRKYESITAPTEAEANLLASRRKYEIERGVIKNEKPEDMTVYEAIERYIDERKESLSPKTIKSYRSILAHHYEGIKNIKIGKLTTRAVQLEANREARTHSPKTVQNIFGLLNGALKEAMPSFDFNIKLPKRTRSEMTIPTHEELLFLFEQFEGTVLELPVLLAATCGFRRGEICALDLEKDVDYENNKITISKSIGEDDNGGWSIKPPKTSYSNRTVDCPPWVIEKMLEAKNAGYKFPMPYIVTNQFLAKCEKCGIKIRFHDLRHYYASLMLSLGVPDKYAMQRMGHSTPNMLKNVYQHIMDDKNQAITEQINGFFSTVQHEMQHDFSKDGEKEKEKDD